MQLVCSETVEPLKITGDVMLKSWTVEGFKSISTKTTLDLAPLTIFAGENSSGKSTVLQSILLVAQTLQSASPGRCVVLNGSILRLGSFSDIVSRHAQSNIISFEFEIAPSGIDYSPYHYGKGVYLSDEFFRDVSKIECGFSFSADESDARENLQLHPRLQKSTLDVSFADSEGRSRIEEVAISRRSISAEQLAIDENLSSESVANIAPIISYSVDKPKSYRPRYRSVAVKNGKPVGAICKHFLPTYLAFSYDTAEAISNGALNSLQPDRSADSASDAKGFELLASSVSIRNILISIITEISEARSQIPRPGIQQSIQRLLEKFTRDNWISVMRNLGLNGRRLVMQRLNEDETSKRIRDNLKEYIPPQTDISYGPFDSRIEQATDYIEWFFANSVKYIGPLRDEPKSLYPLGGGSESLDVGYKGEFTAAVLETHKNNIITYIKSEDFDVLGHKANPVESSLAAAVRDWLRYIGVADGIETSDQGKLGHELRITPVGSETMHELTHVGVGVSQLLPILVQALLMPPNSMLVLEQPELHLHPRVQSRLADFLVSLSLTGKQSIVETHSEYLINKLRFLAAKGEGDGISKLSKIYFVQKESGTSVYSPMCINEFGVITNWPSGFFDEAEELASETIKAAAQKRRNQRMLNSAPDCQDVAGNQG